MQNVPHGVATEIRAGIVEELDGLDADTTAARIEQFGDPAVIAREAGAESSPASVTAGGAASQAHNPLVPYMGGLGLWHSGVLLAFLIIPISGGWLLWRLRGR